MIRLLLCLSISVVFAKPLTLQAALQASHQTDEKQLLKIQQETVQNDADIIIASTLPTINFTTGVHENWQSSKAFLSNPSLSNLSGEGKSISFPTYLQSTNYNWKLSASQPLNIARLGIVKEMAHKQIEILKLQNKNQQNQVSLQIAQSFLQVHTFQKDLLAKTKVLQQQEELEKVSKINVKLGALSEHMWQQVQVQTLLKKNQLLQSELSLSLAKTQLANILNISTVDSLSITDAFIETLMQPFHGKNLEQQWARMQVEYQEKNISFERSYFYPDLNLVGDLSNSNSYSHEEGFSSFNVDKDAYYRPEYFNYSIGLQLNWNLFQGGSTKAKTHKAKLNARKAAIQENQTLEKINKAKTELSQQIPLLASFLDASKKQETLLWQQFTTDQKDFHKGLLRMADLLNSEQNYLQASFQVSQNHTQYILSLLQLRILEGQDLGVLK